MAQDGGLKKADAQAVRTRRVYSIVTTDQPSGTRSLLRKAWIAGAIGLVVVLAGYALYASQKGWVKSADELQTELAYLALPRFVRRSVDQKRLDHAHAFIAKSASTMKAMLLDPLANLGRLEDFAMIDRPTICRRCNFRRLCFPRADEVRPAVHDQPAASPA